MGVPASAGGWSHRSGRFELDRPLVMGILNVTPDSFSDGGRFIDPARAVEQGRRMVEEGAGMLDVGGESTRPGASPVPVEEEIRRVVPVIERLVETLAVPISIDTRRAAVAEAALSAGADVVNDVSALADPRMADVVAATGAGLVLMHMRGEPATMQDDPVYGDVVEEVAASLSASVEKAAAAGVDRERISIDPGIGFGKRYEHNVELIRKLDRLRAIGRPVVLGVSRKAFLGTILGGAPPDARGVATAAACVVGYRNGARIFRVHDVRPAREALQVAHALNETLVIPA